MTRNRFVQVARLRHADALGVLRSVSRYWPVELRNGSLYQLSPANAADGFAKEAQAWSVIDAIEAREKEAARIQALPADDFARDRPPDPCGDDDV